MDTNIWLVPKKISSVAIKRNKISKDNLGFFDEIHRIIEKSKRPLIIFPQGTRVEPNNRLPFKKGVGKIYEELKISCQPVAINSGNVWPKKGIIQSNKKITISILPLINYGLNQDEFLRNLEHIIYSELDKYS